MIRKPAAAIGLAVAFAFAAGAAQAQNSMMAPPAQSKAASKADQKFVTNAIETDMAEEQVGKLAQEKGATDEAKQFGQELVSDHSANEQQAKQLAQSLGMTPPSEPNAKQKAMYEKLNKLKGPAFDRAFAKAMVEGHKANIKLFDKEAKKSGATADFAKQTLPALHKHLEMAESLTKKKQASAAKM